MTEVTLVSADGTKLGARHSGEGSPLVLVHGTTGSIDSFALLEPELARHHSVWVYDRRGRGSSGDTEPYALDREIDDLHAVLQAAGPGAHVLGHSFGGVCALIATASGPDVRSLVLYEPPFHVDRTPPGEVKTACDRIGAGDLEGGLEAFCSIAGITSTELTTLRSIQPVWASMLDGARSAPREISALARLGWNPARYRSVTAPTLLLSGELTDVVAYLSADGLHDAIPTAEAVTLPGQAHLGLAFDPASFTEAVLGFIDRHDRLAT